MVDYFAHFIIASLISLLIFTNKSSIEDFFYTRESNALLGLDIAIENSKTHYNKVAVGVNSNVDLIAPALKVFENLELKSSKTPRNHKVINTLEELEECFLFHFQKCAAAERFVASKEIFDKIVHATKAIDTAQYNVGGNAALMGLKMLYSNKNSTVLLGGPVGPKLKSLLEGELSIPTSLQYADDEYHLILEYGKGERWANHESMCANRFILTHDKTNGELKSLDFFFDSLIEYKPDLVVVSGLHLLDGKSPEFFSAKIEQLKRRLVELPPSLPIHLELASMASKDLMKAIASEIFPVVDSIGLNEQELAFISLTLQGPGSEDELSQWPPEIGLMGDIIDWMLQSYGRNMRYGRDSSRLTRVHFHCLTYHIIAVMPEYWGASTAAGAAGSRAASRQACARETLGEEDVELHTPEYFARSVNYWPLRRFLVKRDQANPVTKWSHNGVDYHFSAVLVCKQPKRTVGLGDCISATGLQYSLFKSAE